MTADLSYWRARCEAAEDALRRARTLLWVGPARREVLDVLTGLRAGEGLTTADVAERTGKTQAGALRVLGKLHAAGFVDRSGARGCHHRPVRWSLGHLVCLDDLEGEGA